MKAPAVFNAVCRNFIQDFDLVASSPEALIDFAITNLSADDLNSLHAFLVEVLRGNHSDDELRTLWWSTPADIHFPNGLQLREFLELMKARVARRLD